MDKDMYFQKIDLVSRPRNFHNPKPNQLSTVAPGLLVLWISGLLMIAIHLILAYSAPWLDNQILESAHFAPCKIDVMYNNATEKKTEL